MVEDDGFGAGEFVEGGEAFFAAVTAFADAAEGEFDAGALEMDLDCGLLISAKQLARVQGFVVFIWFRSVVQAPGGGSKW